MSFQDYHNFLTNIQWPNTWVDPRKQIPRAPTKEQWSEAINVGMRTQAVATNLWYLMVTNPIFWLKALTYTLLMRAVAGYSVMKHMVIYTCATGLSYIFADLLPLKNFDNTPTAAIRNAARMFVPVLLAHLTQGQLAFGSTLLGLVATFAVELGGSALFNKRTGYVFKERSEAVEIHERRLALMGLSLPANFGVLQFFVKTGTTMDVDAAVVTKNQTPS